MAATLLLIHLLAGYLWSDFEVSADGAEYLRMAENMLAGRGFSFDGVNPVIGKPPGFPALLAAYLWIAGSLSGFHTFQLITLFLGYLAIAFITRQALGNRVALVVFVALVALEPIRQLAANSQTEPSYIALCAWGMLFLIDGLTKRRWKPAAIAGILFGLATYIRPVSLFLPLILVVVVFLLARKETRIALVVLLSHILVESPWLVRGYVTTGKLIPMASNWGPAAMMLDDVSWARFSTTGTKDVYQNSPFREAMADEFLFNQGPQDKLKDATVAGWKKDPVGVIRRCLIQVGFAWTLCPGTKEWQWKHPAAFWIGRVAMLAFWIVIIIGLTSFWRTNKMLALVTGGQAVSTALVLFPVATESRYLVPVYICLLPAAACGVVYLIKRAGWSWDR